MVYLANALAMFVQPDPIDTEAMTRRMASHWRAVIDAIAKAGHGRWVAKQDLIGAGVEPYHAELADPEWRAAIIEGSIARITDRLACAYTGQATLTDDAMMAAHRMGDPDCRGIERLGAQFSVIIGEAGADALLGILPDIDFERLDDDADYFMKLFNLGLLFIKRSDTVH